MGILALSCAAGESIEGWPDGPARAPGRGVGGADGSAERGWSRRVTEWAGPDGTGTDQERPIQSGIRRVGAG